MKYKGFEDLMFEVDEQYGNGHHIQNLSDQQIKTALKVSIQGKRTIATCKADYDYFSYSGS